MDDLPYVRRLPARRRLPGPGFGLLWAHAPVTLRETAWRSPRPTPARAARQERLSGKPSFGFALSLARNRRAPALRRRGLIPRRLVAQCEAGAPASFRVLHREPALPP